MKKYLVLLMLIWIVSFRDGTETKIEADFVNAWGVGNGIVEYRFRQNGLIVAKIPLDTVKSIIEEK